MFVLYANVKLSDGVDRNKLYVAQCDWGSGKKEISYFISKPKAGLITMAVKNLKPVIKQPVYVVRVNSVDLDGNINIVVIKENKFKE